ncbi:MAG: hypothetical protein HND44_04465 [Chloroflexi bacterium]|nr:hypothetical protein [Ardenticatenaceae bacterium]MBL1127751.1 hypothetical protein [Chloroflexota bacterium]NOG33818.1 hypothetical protein [Chloroflexota bacterium]GIK54403.1 MAG: hypothetical protein BroJett015_00660 [Chloroflexota bacterium]
MATETTESESALVPVETTLTEAEFDALESLVRLLVGGSIEAPAELVSRLKQWETQVAEAGNTGKLAPVPAATDQLRYALVGLAFAATDQARTGASRFGRLMNASAGRLLRAARPVTNSQMMQPVHRRYESLVTQGETAVTQRIERGRAEEPRSRLVACEAVNLTIDEVIQHLAENPEVRGLVTQQTAGIADEIVGGVRGRTVLGGHRVRTAGAWLVAPPPAQTTAPTRTGSDGSSRSCQPDRRVKLTM